MQFYPLHVTRKDLLSPCVPNTILINLLWLHIFPQLVTLDLQTRNYLRNSSSETLIPNFKRRNCQRPSQVHLNQCFYNCTESASMYILQNKMRENCAGLFYAEIRRCKDFQVHRKKAGLQMHPFNCASRKIGTFLTSQILFLHHFTKKRFSWSSTPSDAWEIGQKLNSRNIPCSWRSQCFTPFCWSEFTHSLIYTPFSDLLYTSVTSRNL